jgi:hypothetical protein
MNPPWWYALALRWIPSRCRAIPEATDPDRILLYQVAIWSRRIYLQSFASGEQVGWSHAHEGPVLCIGLWGSYTDRALIGTERRIRAPYVRYLGREVWHRVADPSRGHTSIFVVIRRERERQYVSESAVIPWQQHVKKEVARI